MSLKRPNHLAQRQVVGRAFSEKLTLIRTVGARNSFGEYTESEQLIPTACATAPVSGSDARARLILEEGVRLEAVRYFWIIEVIDPVVEDHSAGDILLFENERWRVRAVQKWGGFVEALAVRQEPQP